MGTVITFRSFQGLDYETTSPEETYNKEQKDGPMPLHTRRTHKPATHHHQQTSGRISNRNTA